MREALHKAQNLQQQLSAIQAHQQTPASAPQPRQSPSTGTVKQDLKHPLSAVQAQWQTPCSSPQEQPLNAYLQQRSAQFTQETIHAPQQALGSRHIEVSHPACAPDPDIRAQTHSGSLKSFEQRMRTGSSVSPPAQSGKGWSGGGQQLIDMRGNEANLAHSGGCFWRRVCPGIEVRHSSSSAHTA